MPRSTDGSSHRQPHGHATSRSSKNDTRSRSPLERKHCPTRDRRSASPEDGSPRSPRHNKSRHAVERSASVLLPFSARQLTKSDYRTFEPLFAHYLDVQKQRYLEDMYEREARGRWKSFAGKWNRGELAEGWYDPEMFMKCSCEYSWPEKSRHIEDKNENDERNERDEKRSPSREDEQDEPRDAVTNHSDDDDYGPTLPGDRPKVLVGAKSASLQDLSLRNELLQEERENDWDQLRQQRKADRALQKQRLEELMPRAEPGTRERKLEKKKEVNESMRQFREKSPGLEVGEAQLMGGGDELEVYKRIKEREKVKKSERQVRREEFERARREEMEERRRAWREREEGTVSMLKELARQRFG